MRTLLFTLLPSLLAACASAPGVRAPSEGRFVTQREVTTPSGSSCTAYLATAHESVRDAPVVLSMWGTGEYTMAHSVGRDPSGMVVLEAGGAWLAFDKPGVVADETSPGRYRIADEVYNRYTAADLEACAAGALAWASALPQVGPSSPIVIRGHSEGAIVAGNLLLLLHESVGALAPRVTALLLSGAPAGAMREVFRRQVRARGVEAAYEQAFAEGDDAFVRENAGVGVVTLRAMLEARSLQETFAELVNYRPTTRIALFHGLTDTMAPVEMVRELVSENEARLDHGEPGLELAARYYDAGHRLDMGAVHDINLWLLDAIRQPGYFSAADRDAAGAGAVRVAERAIAAVVGRYRIDDNMTLDVRREGTRLFSRATGQEEFPIYFAAEDRLVTRDAPITLELEWNGDWVDALILVQGDRIRCPRVE
ncbi:MAG TPA: hypothetical protein VGD74_11560 [Vulgatibacter sp.]